MPASGVQFSVLRTRLRGLSAISDAEAGLRLNEAHRELVAAAESLREVVDLGPTVAGQQTYALPADVVQLLSLRVNGYGYDRKSIDEIDDLNASDAYIVGLYRGFYAPQFSAGGAAEITIYPTPTQSGLPISGRAAMLPPDLVNDTDLPSLPVDFHWKLVDPGALAITLSLDDERFADAQAKKAEWEQVKLDLRGRTIRRVGGGPARIKLTR